MVEEQPHIEVVGKVDLELEPVLADDLDGAARVEPLVLVAPAVVGALAPAILDVEPLARNVEPREDLGLGVDSLLALAIVRVVLGAW